MQKKDIDFIFQTLDKLYPNADTELKFYNDFQLVLAVVMSAQTTDKQVNKVTEQLFKTIKTPKDIIKM
jgi:endonuclease-3